MGNDIIKLVPTFQSIALLENNLPRKKKKKGIVKQGFENIFGASLIEATSEATNF